MKIIYVFHIGAIFILNICTITATAAVSQPVNSLAIGPITNPTTLSLPANSTNLTAMTRYDVPGTTMRIDFEHFPPHIPREDILMCFVLVLSRAYHHAAYARVREFSSHYLSMALDIDGLANPSPGYEYTYETLVTTLTGIALYMADYNRYMTSRFQIYNVSGVVVPVLLATGQITRWTGHIS